MPKLESQSVTSITSVGDGKKFFDLACAERILVGIVGKVQSGPTSTLLIPLYRGVAKILGKGVKGAKENVAVGRRGERRRDASFHRAHAPGIHVGERRACITAVYRLGARCGLERHNCAAPPFYLRVERKAPLR